MMIRLIAAMIAGLVLGAPNDARARDRFQVKWAEQFKGGKMSPVYVRTLSCFEDSFCELLTTTIQRSLCDTSIGAFRLEDQERAATDGKAIPLRVTFRRADEVMIVSGGPLPKNTVTHLIRLSPSGRLLQVSGVLEGRQLEGPAVRETLVPIVATKSERDTQLVPFAYFDLGCSKIIVEAPKE